MIGFDRSVTLVQDYTDNIAARSNAPLMNWKSAAERRCTTPSILRAKKSSTSEAGRKAIILISDGEDTTSKLKFNEALVAAHQSDTVIYAISNSTRGDVSSIGRRGRVGGGGDHRHAQKIF